jgi:tetratricopeptide (TPR) repeat protein
VAALSAAVVLLFLLTAALVVWQWRQSVVNAATEAQARRKAERLAGAEAKARREAQRLAGIERKTRKKAQRLAGAERKARKEAVANLRRAQAAERQTHQVTRQFFITTTESADLKALGAENLRRQLLTLGRQYFQDFVRRHGNDPAMENELAEVHYRLGKIMTEVSDPRAAVGEFRQCLALRQRRVKAEPGVADHQRKLAQAYFNLAMAYTTLSQRRPAETACRKGIALARRLAGRYRKTPSFQVVLAAGYHQLGALHGTFDEHAPAARAFRKSLEIQERLTALAPGDHSYQRSLAQTYRNLAFTYRNLGRLGPARRALEKALPICQRLADCHPGRAEDQSELAQCLNTLGAIAHQEGELADALRAFQKALVPVQRLAEQHPAVLDYTVDLGGLHCNIGLMRIKFNKAPSALHSFNRAVTLLEQLRPRAEDHPKTLVYLRNSYWGRARALDRLRRPWESATDWGRALALTSGPLRGEFRLRRAFARALAGQSVGALTDVDQLLQAVSPSAEDFHQGARIFALVADGTSDTAGAEGYARWALELLRQAAARGWRGAAAVKEDSVFEALLRRKDFRRGIAVLAASAKKPK